MLIKNRWGRIVSVSDEIGEKMIQKGEGTPLEESPVQKVEERDPLLCPYCDFKAKSERGLKTHLRSCKKKPL